MYHRMIDFPPLRFTAAFFLGAYCAVSLSGCGSPRNAAEDNAAPRTGNYLRPNDATAYESCVALCSENTSLAIVTRTGCLEGCLEARASWPLHDTVFSDRKECLNALLEEDRKKAERIRDKRKMCDDKWTHVHNRKGCYRAVDAFYADLGPAAVCGGDEKESAAYDKALHEAQEKTTSEPAAPAPRLIEAAKPAESARLAEPAKPAQTVAPAKPAPTAKPAQAAKPGAPAQKKKPDVPQPAASAKPQTATPALTAPASASTPASPSSAPTSNSPAQAPVLPSPAAAGGIPSGGESASPARVVKQTVQPSGPLEPPSYVAPEATPPTTAPKATTPPAETPKSSATTHPAAAGTSGRVSATSAAPGTASPVALPSGGKPATITLPKPNLPMPPAASTAPPSAGSGSALMPPVPSTLDQPYSAPSLITPQLDISSGETPRR